MDKRRDIEKVLSGKSESQLRSLIAELFKKHPDIYAHILKWGKNTPGIDVSGKLAIEYWNKAGIIIREYGEYEDCSEYDESGVYGYLEELRKLIPSLTWTTRQTIMDDVLAQYKYGNSGFDDELTDLCFEMCKKREEWLYLADRLMAFGRDWDKKLVMDIYRKIGADDEYLALRTSDLKYGCDYFELVRHYLSRKDKKTALDYAHSGLKKADGELDAIITFLFDNYEKKSDTEELEKIMKLCEKRETSVSLAAGRLFNYYKSRGDYDNAKKHLLKEFENDSNLTLDKNYAKIKKFLTDGDWNDVEPILFAALKKRDEESYMQICLKKGLNQEVYNVICAPRGFCWGGYDKFADKIKVAMPKEIIEYYMKLAIENIMAGAGSNRKNYAVAVGYLKKVKQIYIDILNDKPTWLQRFADLLEQYRKRKAFLQESKALE